MPDYYLGKARGEVVVDYDDKGLNKAQKGFEKLGREAQKTGRSLKDLERESKSLEQQEARLAEKTKEVGDLQEAARVSTANRVAAERELNKVLKDSTATVEQNRKAFAELSRTRTAQIAANQALRRAERALAAEITATNAAAAAASGGDRKINIDADTANALVKLAKLKMEANGKGMLQVDADTKKALRKIAALKTKLNDDGETVDVDADTAAALAKVAALQNKANSRATINVDADVGKALAKIAVLNRALASAGKGMGGLSLAGGAGLLGAGGLGMILPQVMGAVAAIGTLSGAVGTLPGVVGGAVLAFKTLSVATYGFGDAMKAMAIGDTKKFAEQLQKMSPIAQQAALEFYRFSAQIKELRNSVGDSFFGPFVNDIAALGQTYMPMLKNAMDSMAGTMGTMVHEFMSFLNTSEGMSLMQATFDNMKAGLAGLAPAVQPFTKAWLQIMDVSSSFLPQLSADVVKLAQEFGAFIDKARASGDLAKWIQTGIDAVKSLMSTIGQLGGAFGNIFNIANTSGGGFLNTINMLATKFNEWTSSVQGKEALSSFFTSLAGAAKALAPIMEIIGNTLVGTVIPALANLGTAIAPGIEVFFTQLSSALKTLQPALEASAPALNLFLMAMGDALKGVITALAPVLPKIMDSLAKTFEALLPILPELAVAFGDMLVAIAPLLPQLARLITPVIVGLLQDFAKIMREMSPYIQKAADWIGQLATRVAEGKKRFEEMTGQSGPLGALWEMLKTQVAGAVEVFKKIWEWCGKVAEWFYKLQDAGSAVGETISVAWEKLVEKIKEVWNKIVNIVTDFIPNLVKAGLDAGKALIDAIGDGILNNTGIFGKALKWIGDKVRGATERTTEGTPVPEQNGAPNGAAPQGRSGGGGFLSAGAAATPVTLARSASAAEGGGTSGPSGGGAPTVYRTARAFGGASGSSSRGTGYGSTAGPSGMDFSTIEQFVRDMMQITDLFSSLVNFSQSISDIVFQTLDYVKQLAPQMDMFQPGKWERTVSDKELVRQQEDNAYKQKLEDEKKLREQQNSPGYLNPLPANAPPELGAALAGKPLANASLAGLTGKAFDQALLSRVPAGRYEQTQNADLTQGLADCTSSIEDLVNMMDNKPTGGRSMATGNAKDWLESRGFVKTDKPMPGTFQVGFFDGAGNDGHMQATLPGGTKFNWGGNASAAQRGIGNSGAWDDPRFTDFYYRPIAGLPTAPATPPAVEPTPVIPVSSTAPKPLSQLTPEELAALSNPSLTPATTPTALPPTTPTTPLVPGLSPVEPNANGLIPEAQQMVDDVAKQQLSVQEQQLEELKAQSPLLKQALEVAQNPASSEAQVIEGLNTISAESAKQRALDTAESRSRAQALDSAASKVGGERGLTQGASPVDQAANIAQGAFTIASDVIGLIQSTMESISAAKEISGKLVAGVQNTEDIFKMVDNVQVFIDTAAKAAQAVGNVAGMAGGMSGGMDMGISSGIAAAAGMIAGGLQAANAAIDIGQEVYRIVGKYAGGLLGTLAGGGQGALLGDVKFMLDKNTGELVSQTAANPQDQRRMNVPQWLNWAYDYRGDAWQPGVQAQLNVYAGPGQSVHDTMNETMWLVNAGGAQAGPMNSAGNF